MLSPFPSSPSPAYMDPSFGSGGMMAHFSTSSFDGSHIPQLILTVGGWNLPSYKSNHGFTLPGESAQMGGYSAYFIPSIYPAPAMSVPTNTFPTTDLHPPSGISYRGSQFYSMGYPLPEIPSSGGNIYPHPINPCHTFFSS
jgi:hypothetical protein